MHKAFTRLTRTMALVFALVLTAGYAQAQVAVSIADVSGRQGETVTVPVVVSGVSAGTPINSFGFTVATPAGITFTGVETAGTLSAGFGGNVSSNATTGAVGGFGAALTGNGTLINLTFTYDNPFAGSGTVNLNSFQISGAAVSPATPSFGFLVTDRFMNVASQNVVVTKDFELEVVLEDALVAGDNVNAFSMDITYDPTVMTIDKTKGSDGAISTGTLTDGRTVSLNDVGGANSGTVRVAGFGSTITGSGTLFKIAFKAVAAGTSTSTISNVSFQAGNPSYGLRTGTTTITVNTAPVATAGTLTVAEDGSGDVTLTGTDGDGDALTFAIASQPANGTVTLVGAVATYTPNANYNGADSFTFTANDGTDTSAAATVSVTVTAVNDVPVAADASATTVEDTAVDITLSGTDADGDALTFTATNGSNGTVSVTGSTATYTPAANFNGTDTFTYTANDGTADSAPATVTVTVTAQNDAPVVAAVTATVDEDNSVEITLAATDAEGDAVTFAVTDPSNGTVALAGDKVTYTPAANFNGTDTFTYTANDGTSDSAAGTVTVTVNPVNDAPVFTAEMADVMIAEDNGTLSFTYVATDVDGDALTYSIAGAPAGSTFDATTGAFSVDPSGKAGVYTIVGTVTDGTVSVNATAATVTIYSVNMRYGSLSGIHQVGPIATPGNGTVWVRLVEDTNTMEVWGTFSDLQADYSGSHIHLAGVGQNGGVGVALTATVGADNRSGEWTVANNTFNVAGMSDLVSAVKSGGAYVNVHSAAYPAGEIRGQVLSAGNAAPGAATSLAPSLVNVAGDGMSTAYAISWLPVADPDGDTINYLLQIAMDANFTMTADLTNFGQTNGMAYTVEEAAELFDFLTANDPNSDGTTAVFYHRVITTDGSLWTAGPSSSTSLRRGAITDTENASELPTEFALKGNYPNPFNPSTNIRFDLPQSADVSVVVVDLLGRQVLSVPSATFEAGAGKTIQLDASDLSSGIYMYQIIARSQGGVNVATGTMTLIK